MIINYITDLHQLRRCGYEVSYSVIVRFLLTIFFIGAFQPKGESQTLYGSWKGVAGLTCRAMQCDTERVSIELQGVAGVIEYADAGCKGTLVFENRAGDILYYREYITAPGTKCGEGAIVSVMPSGDELVWTRNNKGSCWSGVLQGKRILQPCGECKELRDKCYTGCRQLPDATNIGNCISDCNKEFSCITGMDCK